MTLIEALKQSNYVRRLSWGWSYYWYWDADLDEEVWKGNSNNPRANRKDRWIRYEDAVAEDWVPIEDAP